MKAHDWKHLGRDHDDIAGFRCMKCARCGLVGYLRYGLNRDDKMEIGKEPVFADVSSVVGSQTIPMRAFTSDEKDCDVQEVVNVMDS